MQSKITKTATANNIIQELASARALSALCGGSGVGQAPEPPQRAGVPADSSAKHLPEEPSWLSSYKVLDLHGLRAAAFAKATAAKDIHGYELGEKENVAQEEQVQKVFLGLAEVKGKRKKLRELKEIKGNLREFKGKVKGIFQTPRMAFRYALQTASYTCILVALVGFCFAYGPVIKAETGYRLKILSNTNQYYQILTNTNKKNSAKAKNVKELPKTNAEEFVGINFPADTSIVIPKIDAAAEIVSNVDPSNYEEYMAALQKGVAHAKGTALPGMVGNSYLFAHSAGNLFDIARFNAVFYLIGKLEKNDAIYVKFGNEKFKYTVVDKKEVDPTDVQFLTGNLEGVGGIEGIEKGDRTLTLQTCVPPGTDWRRLLIFAKIEK